jgi:ribosomal protein S18 acetylase RimI-like enzyme
MNDGALRFYERLGFTVVEDFETYVLMEWLPTD